MGRLSGARAERALPLDQPERAAAGRKRGTTSIVGKGHNVGAPRRIGKVQLLLVCLMPVAVSAQYSDGSDSGCEAGKYSEELVIVTTNPPETSRSYSSVHDNHEIGTGFAQSMLDSPQAWSAGAHSAGNTWMKIDLGLVMRVHGVVIQARQDQTQYVTEVEVQHSLDPNSGFSSLQSLANDVRFFPTSISSNPVKSELKSMELVVARYIKIVVWSWYGHISMRAGVLTSPGDVTNACTSCPAGTYSDVVGANSSSTCSGTPCSAGKYGQSGATSASAATCSLCPAGKYSAAGASVKYRQYSDPLVNYARACGASLDQACPASQSSTIVGGIAERAVDNAGQSGQWSSESCTHTDEVAVLQSWWRVDMQESVLVTALKIAGRADCCYGKTQGYSIFVGDKEPANLEQNSACVTGQPYLPPGGEHDITCTSPVQGRYVYFVLPLGQALTLCEVSVFGSTPNTGLIASAPGASVCRDCPAHTFSEAGSKAFVTCTCNKGYTGPDGGECTACDAGGFKDTNGSAACTLCSQGKYSAAGASVCIDCDAGKYSEATGQTTCIDCAAGQYSVAGDSTCSKCPAGKYSTGDIVNKARGCGDGSSPCSVSASSWSINHNYQYPSLAVDGLIAVAHQSNTGNFFHTECNKANEWFMLDLESEYEIASVRIFNIEPFESLSGAEIRVGKVDSFDGNPTCASNLPGDSVITVTCGATGRYVFVVQPRSDTCLHFSEIEVPIRLGCIGTLCSAGKFGQTGATSASAATCSLCPAGKYSAGATGAAACVLTAPSPDTCYGAAAMIDLLNASCPRDHATQKTTPTSCGTSACAFFISAIDDRKFALVKAGLQECAGDSTNPFTGFSDWFPKWNDELIRHQYAKYCGLPFGVYLWAKHSNPKP
jgi:hypothetical protein